MLSIRSSYATHISGQGGGGSFYADAHRVHGTINPTYISSSASAETDVLIQDDHCQQHSFHISGGAVHAFEDQRITLIYGRAQKYNFPSKPAILVNHTLNKYYILNSAISVAGVVNNRKANYIGLLSIIVSIAIFAMFSPHRDLTGLAIIVFPFTVGPIALFIALKIIRRNVRKMSKKLEEELQRRVQYIFKNGTH